jgi:agmatine deiminase
MPAEWAPHAACILLYPHLVDNFDRLEQARAQVLQVAQTIASADGGGEPVWLLCRDEETAAGIRTKLLSMPALTAGKTTGKDDSSSSQQSIVVGVCPSNDTWARDTAPTFCISPDNQRLVALDWKFNAYGGPEEGCYWPCDLDQAIAERVSKQLPQLLLQLQPELQLHSKDETIVTQVTHVPAPLVLEGGSIHTDGEGTILTTEECLLHPNRNPDLTRIQIEDLLKQHLGASKIIWLPYGLAFDEDTNGHVDNFACFAAPAHVLLAWTDDQERDPENYQRCRAAHRILMETTDSLNRPFQITKLYLPSPPLCYQSDEVNAPKQVTAVERVVGQRLAASYVNFYIANNAVLVPQFGVSPTDRHAVETLQDIFPGRQVVGVASREILLGGGNIHCITQQVPRISKTL